MKIPHFAPLVLLGHTQQQRHQPVAPVLLARTQQQVLQHVCLCLHVQQAPFVPMASPQRVLLGHTKPLGPAPVAPVLLVQQGQQ